jgi:hypothetical protein
MALTFYSGHDLTLTVNSVTYTNVAASATIAIDINQVPIETLGGRYYKVIDQTATLTAELYQDWGSTSPASVCAALWALANSAPNTAVTFSLAAGGKTLSGSCYPVFPEFGGGATDALTTSLSFTIDKGAVTLA